MINKIVKIYNVANLNGNFYSDRLEQEAETLQPCHDHNSDKTIVFVSLSTEVHSKAEFVCSKTTTSMQTF